MSDSQPNADQVNSILQRVNSLGTATEQFFSRVYRSLTRRSELERSQKAARKYYQTSKRMKARIDLQEVEIERLSGILATLDEGLIMQDLEGRVVFINDAARELIGNQRTFRESEISSLFDAYRDVENLDAELTRLGEPQRLQMNNRIIGTQLVAVADSENQRIGTLVILRDITREALNDRLKDQFATAITHELRTPMNVIKMSSEVLLGSSDDMAASNRKLLNTLGRNVDVLDRMIVELLDISEMTAGTFTIRQDPVNTEDLVWSVVNGMLPEVKKGKLDVIVMARHIDNLSITGDDERLRWALGHLLQNSIRYTEAGGNIIVSVGVAEEDTVEIQIMDTGVGVAPKDLPHIFERFYRGEPRTPSGRLLDPRGLGQGLFVARTVAEAHNGYLSVVHSAPGEGSVFSMVLPTTQPTPSEN